MPKYSKVGSSAKFKFTLKQRVFSLTEVLRQQLRGSWPPDNLRMTRGTDQTMPLRVLTQKREEGTTWAQSRSNLDLAP